MSTSKKRRKARAWMQEERARHESVERGLKQACARRVADEVQLREEMMRAIPSKTSEYDNADGSHHVRSFVKFPDPLERRNGTFIVPMPPLPMSTRELLFNGPMYSDYARQRRSEIVFRPIEHAFTERNSNGDTASLTWFTWEPTRGSDELVTHTTTATRLESKLRHVRARFAYSMRGYDDQALEMLDDVCAQLAAMGERFAR